MSSNIPKGIREKVLFLWLQGISRDEIAKIVGIGAGSVSEIMKVYRSNDSDIDLEREYVVNVKKSGYDIDKLESVIRLNRLENLNLDQEQVEDFLDNMVGHCYKHGSEPERFIRRVDEACRMSRNTKVHVEDLPFYIRKMQDKLFTLNMHIIMKEVEISKARQKLNLIEMILREFGKIGILFYRTKAPPANVTWQ